MGGKKILGMVLVMAMLATAMPLLSGSAKAETNPFSTSYGDKVFIPTYHPAEWRRFNE